MPYQFTVSPDFLPTQQPGWHIFNTLLQKNLGVDMHLELYDSFESQRDAIKAGKVDLIYANPYDASILVREKGFLPLVKPKGKSDEAMVVVNTEHASQHIEDLQPGLRIASTADPDIQMMGMIMIEPADLNSENTTKKTCDTYVMVAKELLRGESDIGFFLSDAFNSLSGTIRNQLRPLVGSQIQVIHHTLMIGPELLNRQDDLLRMLVSMGNDAKNGDVLESIGLAGWDPMDLEEMEFMIDLVDTLAV